MSADLPLTPEDVDEIVSILDRTPYDRLEIRSERFSLSVARSGAGWVQSWDFAGEGTPAVASPVPAADTAAASAVSAAGAAAAEVEGQQLIRAALPGTFYRSPSPGAAPFVDLGSAVLPDTVVGIIETMKLMTPVHAGVSGVVVALLVEDATVVDEQAALMRVKTSAT